LIGIALAVGLLAAAGCAGGSKRPPTGTPEPDKFLFERGTEALDKRKWLVAREYFRELMDTYPQSRYRADAKLGIGDTYVGEHSAESSVLALNEFREFLNFYPTHPRADYAQFKLGMTHFYQMHSADRDQTETREAIQELALFVERYPAGAIRLQRRLPLLSLALVPRRRRSLRDADQARSGVHPPRRGVLLPRRMLHEGESAGQGAALVRQTPQGVRAERVPGGGTEAR
jgi:hypothetical protein